MNEGLARYRNRVGFKNRHGLIHEKIKNLSPNVNHFP
jgi:hypothetical protein